MCGEELRSKVEVNSCEDVMRSGIRWRRFTEREVERGKGRERDKERKERA